MSTREVPREEWVSFCDSFSRQHEGWRVTVEVLGAGLMYVPDPFDAESSGLPSL